jgi:hypothetical protein
MRAALTALDQMPNGKLQAVSVLPLLQNPSAAVQGTAIWIVGQHPDWGQSVQQYFEAQLQSAATLNAQQRDVIRGLLARLASAPEIQQLLQKQLNTDAAPATRQLAL